MMDQRQEHAATLCAFGTIGLAVAGLALGTDEENIITRPGKRKSPGSDAAYPSSPPLLQPSRRATSGPVVPFTTPSPTSGRSLSSSIFGRKRPADLDQNSTEGSLPTQSRESSVNRKARLPRVPGQPYATEEDARPRSSWMRRLSTMSSLHTQSPTSSTYKFDMTPTSSPHDQGNVDSNRLVKRSTSQRNIPNDQAKRLFRRPATSHQRSASMIAIPVSTPSSLPSAGGVQGQSNGRPVSGASVWKPFFSSDYPRKRPTTPGTRDQSVRTVSMPYTKQPTLVNARAVRRQSIDDDTGYRDFRSSPEINASAPRQRLRRSLSSFRKNGRQRYFTEPVVSVSNQTAQGSILPTKQSRLSPASRSSTFDIELPPGTPIFTSSPLIVHAPRTNPSINKRISVAPSDPNTISSDNETRLFSDDESMDFHSDTAYDSLATRATVSSQSGYRQPKIDSIFNDNSIDANEGRIQTLEALMERSNLNGDVSHTTGTTSAWNENVGIAINANGLEDDDEPMDYGQQTLTPVREHPFGSVEELNATPIAFRRGVPTIIGSSPPSSVVRRPAQQGKSLTFNVSEDVDMRDDDSIDWSPKSERDSKKARGMGPDSPIVRRTARLLHGVPESESKRSSIFDWSENQKSPGESSNGISPRPKTVHGKQADDQGRSRAAGRKGPSALHLRSQSVPVNRESGSDLEVPTTNSKFGTWGLGNKPVSEEWSDDFDFDDAEEDAQPLQMAPENQLPGPRDSQRSVKVPQSIIDRQASVHQQFSQVQEFMMLVEELKRLRAQAVQLNLLEGHSRKLWDDAENIINLATLNEEDEVSLRPSSPVSSDIFGDDTSPSSRRISADDSRWDSFGIRAASNPATPPSASRPRGESLAQAKNFLQAMHHNRGATDLSPPHQRTQREKLPFDTQDLRELVSRASSITRSLKDIVRRAQGVNVSPERTPQKQHDPSFSQLFNPPDSSPCPPMMRQVGISRSRSANDYLSDTVGSDNDIPSPLKVTMIEV